MGLPRPVWTPAFALELALMVGCGLPCSAHAASTPWIGDKHAAVRLVTAVDAVSEATSIDAGVEFRYAEGWHGYWRTPGDAGVPPAIDWSGTANLSAATIAWPAPRRAVIDGLQNSVYEGRVIIPVRLIFATPPDAKRATADLHAAVDYAACSNVCVPFHADLQLSLPPGPAGESAEAAIIAEARAAVPRRPKDVGIDVLAQSVSGAGKDRRLVVSLRSDEVPFQHPDLFVEGVSSGIPPAPNVQIGDGGRTATLTVDLGTEPPNAGEWTETLVDGPRSAEFAGPSRTPAMPGGAIWPALLSALLGGMVLNLMPCVLPILSIKLVGLTRRSGASRREARLGFAVTGLGVVTSFLLIAVALVGLKWSGASLGWGIQFQQPWFLAVMATLTVTFAASLFDWLHVGVPQALVGLSGAGTIKARSRFARWGEPFLAGAFATLLATPCSAPFVGTAVGFALAGSALDILVIFLGLGLGMASPFLVAALVPGVAGWLPRPGPWMVTLRRVLGLLLLGTAAWLLAVLWSLVGGLGTTVAGLLLAALLAALWLAASPRRADRRWPMWAAISCGLLTIAAAVALPSTGVGSAPVSDDGVAFDPATLDRLVGEGKTVLVDVSASWCLTCKVNELTALKTVEVRGRLERPGTVLMRADWSRPDPVIARYIQSFGRFGVPLDVVYGPGRPKGEALPELLTAQTVRAALDGVASTPERSPGNVSDREGSP